MMSQPIVATSSKGEPIFNGDTVTVTYSQVYQQSAWCGPFVVGENPDYDKYLHMPLAAKQIVLIKRS